MFRKTDTRSYLLPSVAVFVIVASASALAIDVELVGEFQGSSAKPFDYFGHSVGLRQDSLIVGSHGGAITFDDEDYYSGLAYIFEKSASQWQQAALLYPHDYADPGISFGWAVDIDGAFAVVTSPWEVNYEPGSVYVFLRSSEGWSEIQQLGASDAAPYWEFGRSVSLADDLLVVGTFPQSVDPPPPDGSKAYVFERTGTLYSETQILTATDGTLANHFGYAVEASTDWIFIGAPGASVMGSGGEGAVYVFAIDESGWYEYQKLIRSDNDENYRSGFGWAIDFDGTSLIVGDIGAINSLGQHTGGAYVFTFIDGVWVEQQKLIPGGLITASAGDSVGIEDDIAIVGHSSVNYSGEAFVFTRSDGEWTEQLTLSKDPANEEEFATSLSIENGQVVIGAPMNDIYPYDGSAYLYNVGSSEQIDCIGFDAPLDDYPVTIRGRRPALPLRATLKFEDGTLVTDIDVAKPPVVVVYPNPAEDDEAMDITGDVTPSITPDVGNEFLFTTGGVWQFILGLENYSASGTYTVRMESGDPGNYEFDEQCITEFIVP